LSSWQQEADGPFPASTFRRVATVAPRRSRDSHDRCPVHGAGKPRNPESPGCAPSGFVGGVSVGGECRPVGARRGPGLPGEVGAQGGGVGEPVPVRHGLHGQVRGFQQFPGVGDPLGEQPLPRV
jgi:hypothetical protein